MKNRCKANPCCGEVPCEGVPLPQHRSGLRARKRHDHWRVSVETSGEQIVAIESDMLAGREISEADEDAIRTAAHHLLAFIGDPSPPTRAEGEHHE